MSRTRAFMDFCSSFRAKPWPLEKPVVLQFPVNDICDAQCQMCLVWQQKLAKQISCDELAAVLENPLFSEIRYVGVNGGEPTLRHDLADLVDVLFRRLPKLEGVSLITNALVPSRVISGIEAVGKVVQSTGGIFDVMVSLDGVGEGHDRVRGREGAFDNACQVIKYLHDSTIVTNYSLGCTVVKENVFGLHDLLDFAIGREAHIKFRLGIPHKRLYNEAVADDFALSFEEKLHFATFLECLATEYEDSRQQQFFYRSLIGQLLHNSPRKAGCDWQHRGVTLSSRGELMFCAVESDVLGSALDEDASRLYFGGQGYLDALAKTKCAECAHDYVGLMTGPARLKAQLNFAVENKRFPFNIISQKPVGPFLKEWWSRRLFTTRLKSFGVDDHRCSPTQTFKKQQGTTRRVMICGWYGTETLGDKAILAGVLKAIGESLSNVDLTLVSLDIAVSKLTAIQMPELQDTCLCTVEEGLELTATMDLVVFGGGPIMALDNLAEMIAVFERAARHGVPTLMAGCGVGPLGSTYHNKAVKRLLQSFSQRIYRDERSRQLAGELGINTDLDLVAEDPAFTWLEEKSVSLNPPKKRTDQELTLLLGLRRWPYNQYAYHLTAAEGKMIQDRFEAALMEGLAGLVARYPRIKLFPFPMCTNHLGGDDRWYYRQLFREHTDFEGALDYSALSREVSPDEAYELFSAADAALTMRFHSLVFALGAGLPAVAVDYTLGSGKVASLAETHGVPCKPLNEVDSAFILEELSSQLQNCRDRQKRMENMPVTTFSSVVDVSIGRLI